MFNKTYEEQYLDLLRDILENGVEKSDRTGVGIKSVFVRQLRIDMSEGFPILTTRKFNYRNPIEEFLFMIRGDLNTKLLEDKGVKIWSGNSSRSFLDNRNLQHLDEGELGEIYGFNMRNFGGDYELYKKEGIKTGLDQVVECINLINNDPNSRRILMTTHNPSTTDNAVLYACHGLIIQFWVNPLDKTLSLSMLQRSCDAVLGKSCNVPYYYLMLRTIAEITNLKPSELIITTNDTHIYLNHIEKVKKQLERTPYKLPQLIIKKPLKTLEDIEQLSYDDFEIIDYKHHSGLIFPMAI